MSNELTPENFVAKIKLMAKRDRQKIPAEKLIELICQMSDPPNVDVSMPNQLEEMHTSFKHIQEMATINQTEIATLKIRNAEYTKNNVMLSAEVELLKIHAKECKANRQTPPVAPAVIPQLQPAFDNRTEIKNLQEQITALQGEINNIQQYLRVNNLEIVGLPEPSNGETDETLLINALNQLEGLDSPVRRSSTVICDFS